NEGASMTEQEWLGSDDPKRLLEFLRGKATERKLRLFAVACCRRVWPLMIDYSCQQAVEASERHADVPMSEWELDAISAEAEEAFENAVEDALDEARRTGEETADSVAMSSASAASYASSPGLGESHVLVVLESTTNISPAGGLDERRAQATLIRDIFGNPF